MLNTFSLLDNKEIKLKKPADLSQMKKIKDLFNMMICELSENLQLKTKLFSIQGFFPDILFLKLDFFSKKNISTKDILHYLEQHNYKFNDEMVRRFIKQYDKHGNYNLIYDDFLKMISPFDDNISKNIDNNDYKKSDDFFCQILLNELKLVGIIGEMALQIKKNDEFNSYDIFMEISKNENFIDKKILSNFLLLDGNFTEMEINLLIYYIDSNNDGIITYEDFHDLLMPIQSDFETNENNNEYPVIQNDYITNNQINNNNYFNEKIFPNTYYNYLLDNTNIYSPQKDNPNINSNDKFINKTIDLNNNNNKNSEIIYDEKINNKKSNQDINVDNVENNIDQNMQNIYNKEKLLLYNKYLDNYNIDEQNENKDCFANNTTMNFFPKILKDEKVDILPDISENIFSKSYFLNRNHNNTIDINYSAINNDLNIKKEELKNNNNTENNIRYNNNYSPNEENEIIHNIYHEKENNFNNQNENDNNLNKIALQQFPITFGLNHENNDDEHEQQFINNMNNNNKINFENAHKDEMNYIINKYLHNNNINDNDNGNENNNIDNHYDDIKFKTVNSQQKMNLDTEKLINNEANNNLLSPKTYSYQIKGKENINIVNNLDIKNNIKHHSKKTKNKKCPNIIEAINNFLEYINIIILNENRIEHLKENLALREDLSLKEIFFLFDKDQNNYISINNFQLICKKVFNLFPTIDQVKLVFKRYKKQNKKKTKEKEEKENNGLNLEEFITMMTPKKTEYINIIDKKNKLDKTNLKLSVKSKKILNELIKCLLQKESDYYKVRNKFDSNCLELLWKEITKYSKNGDRINKKQMNKFLEKYGYVMQEKQIDNIFFIFDKEQKGKIKNNDFRKEMCSD